MNAAATHPRPRLRLADHVRACNVGDQVVLLDLARNRYLGLDGRRWRAVATSMGHRDLRADHPDAQSQGTSTVLEALRRKRILTTAPAREAKSHPLPRPLPLPLPLPAMSIDVRQAAADGRITLVDLGRFFAATTLAATWLRFRSLDAIARCVEDLHHRCQPADTHGAERLMNSVAVFDRLRPLAFTSKEKCLFDSLALTIFLARQGIAVHWVIGVATQPFRAHSWVQNGPEVLNDLHERVSRFTPLLVV
jgi:hypothetical protein